MNLYQQKLYLEIKELQNRIKNQNATRKKIVTETEELQNRIKNHDAVIKKIEVEINELENQQNKSPKKNLPLIGILTLALGYLSFTLPFDLQKENQKNQTFIRLLEQATTAETPEGRIAGIWMLNSYWDNSNDSDSNQSFIRKFFNWLNSDQDDLALYKPIANTLSGIVTSDQDYFVRLAAAEVIGNAYQKDLQTKEREEALRFLLYGDGGTGENGTLTWANQRLAKRCADEIEEADQKECLSKLNATKEAIRKNWENLENINLRETDLSDSSLYKANLKRANLSKAVLQGTNFRDADLSRVNLIDADLTKADLRGANLKQAIYNESTKLKGVQVSKNIDDIKKYMYYIAPNSDLSNANLSGVPLQGADLSNANLINSKLNHANLSRAKILNADLSQADLSGTIFVDTQYNNQTKFPDDFDPKAAEMIEVK